MAAFVVTSRTILLGTAWTGTAPGSPGTQSISGTITSTSALAPFLSTGGEVGYAAEMVANTDMAGGGFTESLPGLVSGDDIVIPLTADFASSQTWSIITSVFGALGISRPGDAERYIDIKATSASRSATNPSFAAAVFSKGVQPIQGDVGAKGVSGLTLQVTGAFAWLTS